MRRAFLVLDDGLLERGIFRIEGSMTIGRSPSNPIHLNDPGASWVHARIYDDGMECIIEDLKSTNGTFLNGRKISKAKLHKGSTIRIGNSIFRYMEDEEDAPDHFTETQEIGEPSGGKEPKNIYLRPRSRRLEEAIDKIPIFKEITPSERKELALLANLHIYQRGEIIIREGDPGRSLYLVLDGRVRVFTYDYVGNRIFLFTFGPDQFFGEIGLITGAPRSASVMAAEESLLAEIPFKRMRDLLYKYPNIRRALEECSKARIQDTSEKKAKSGAMERRLQPRLNAELPVKFVILSEEGEAGATGKVFRAVSLDISISGIRLQVEEEKIESFPLDGQLKMEIKLSGLSDRIRARGKIKNRRYDEDNGFVVLGIQFIRISAAGIARLREFIYGQEILLL